LRTVTRYTLSIVAVAAAAALAQLLARSSLAPLTLMPFALSVTVAVWLGGFGPGVAAVLLSALAVDYVIIGPGVFLETASTGATVSVYSVMWLSVCFLGDRVYRRAARDRHERRVAEGVAAQSDRLAELTAALGRARTPSAVIEAALQEPLHALAADAGTVLLVSPDGTSVQLARKVGYHADQGETEPVPGTRTPASDAIGRGAPVFLESPDARASEYGDQPLRPFGAFAAVPLVLGSRVVAVVQLEFLEPRSFSRADREYLETMGPRAAQALDRTWQHESAVRAREEAETLRARAADELAERQKADAALRASEARYRAFAARTSRLHGLAAALSEAVTLQAVARAVVEQGCNVLGATNGDVTLLVEGGTQFETLHSDGSSPEAAPGSRFAVESGLCATEAVLTRRPVFVKSFAEWQQRYSRSAAIAADGGCVSSATLPLLVDGGVAGVLGFHFTAPVNFDEEYQALLTSVAHHCVQALERARLYDAAQRARGEAEAANRERDEFISIVSHELRAPLNAILGWTSTLQQGLFDPSTAGRALQSIFDNATRQSRLIEDLLDFSRLTSGRMTLDVDEVDLRTLLRSVVESSIPAAAAKGLSLEIAPVDRILIRGDARRLQQVFSNLLGNALKFTPAGGRIEVGVGRAPDRGVVEVRLTDTGEGIDPDFLPRMFDRFRQADGTPSRHGGAGLGLAIARELVEAHRGAITAESAGPGRGATFVVSLPIEPMQDGSAHGPQTSAGSESTIH
jgi:signal transduction histidine kinase